VSAFFNRARLSVQRSAFAVQSSAEGETYRHGQKRVGVSSIVLVLVDCFPHEQNDHDHDDEDDPSIATRF
jgi:hypothetical protein